MITFLTWLLRVLGPLDVLVISTGASATSNSVKAGEIHTGPLTIGHKIRLSVKTDTVSQPEEPDTFYPIHWDIIA